MIEIKKPGGAGGALSINYIETDLTGSDFTKLATEPLTIVPAIADKFIIPIFFQIAYSFTAGLPFQASGVFIANQNTINGFFGCYYFNFNVTDFASVNIGFLTFPVLNTSFNNFLNQSNNVSVNSSIIFSAPVDDNNSSNIQSLKIRVGYYILDQF
jgi:hypothetical protein